MIPDSAESVQGYLHAHIPISREIGVRVAEASDERIILCAPLEPNLNHEDNAFGGSISALAVLSGWTYLAARLHASAEPSRIVIQHSEVDYLQPIRGEFCATCPAPSPSDWAQFYELLEKRGKGRIKLECEVSFNGSRAAHFKGTYVAFV